MLPIFFSSPRAALRACSRSQPVLQPHPELPGRARRAGEANGGIGSDRALAVHDYMGSALNNVQRLRATSMDPADRGSRFSRYAPGTPPKFLYLTPARYNLLNQQNNPFRPGGNGPPGRVANKYMID